MNKLQVTDLIKFHKDLIEYEAKRNMYVTCALGLGISGGLIYAFKNRIYNNFKKFNEIANIKKINKINLVTSVKKYIPFVNTLIKNEIGKAIDQLEDEILKPYKDVSVMTSLPEKGWDKEEIIERLDKLKKIEKYDWINGAVSGTVYYSDKEHNSLLAEAENKFYWSNPNHPDIFPGIRMMEAEIINMCHMLMGGEGDACGVFTSGGTESIIMAVRAYKEMHKNKFKRDCKDCVFMELPNIIMSETAHASFSKACDLMDIEVKMVGIDYNTRKMNLNEVESAIDKNTILIVASAPAFSHGIVDDIKSLGEIAKSNNISLHVDSCLGGFLTAFSKEINDIEHDASFRTPGVTSISVDTHKYAYAPKGSSVILFRNPEIRRYAYFICSNWTGGIYATSSLTGTRPGNIIAGTWAALTSFGLEGYRESAKKINEALMHMKHGIEGIGDLFIYGNPHLNVIGIGSNTVNIYTVAEKLNQNGWNLNMLQNPKSIHFCITLQHTDVELRERFIKDMREAVEYAKKNSTFEGSLTGMYGTMVEINDNQITDDIIVGYLNTILKLQQNKK